MQLPITKPIIPDSLEHLRHMLEQDQKIQSEETERITWGIYTRLSRVDENQKQYSLEIQPDKAEDYAKAHGAQHTIVYSDPDQTGRNSRRKELIRMMNDIRAGRVQIVVVHRLDRLYRNLESLLKFIRFLKEYKVRLISVTEQIDTESWWGRLVLVVLGAMAEMYVHQVSDRTRESKTFRVRSGLPNGNLPIGYCNGLCSTCDDVHGKDFCPNFGGKDREESRRGRVAIPHPITSHVVPLIFEQYLKGMSYREIAVWLNSHDVSLPDGKSIRLKTKKKEHGKSNPEGLFSRDGIRAIIENPFFAGLIARYERPDLDMDDDPENPYRKPKAAHAVNTRKIVELQPGLHQPLIAMETWQAVSRYRQMKTTVPLTSTKNKRIYPLTGISRCWECYEHNGSIVTLRGTTIKNQKRTYRCATIQDRTAGYSKKLNSAILPSGLAVHPNTVNQALLEKHQIKYLSGDVLEEQVNALMERLTIPEEWTDLIAAYFISEEGMSLFERESFNLRQARSRFLKLYMDGDISPAEYKEQKDFINKKLAELKPSIQPEAQVVMGLLQNFPSRWKEMTTGEQRLILQTMFQGLYFDSQGKLRKALAHPPFDELLGLKEDLAVDD